MLLSLNSTPSWLDILVCPKCKAKLHISPKNEMVCSKCEQVFPLRNNIPVMISPLKGSARRQLIGKETSELEPWFERSHELEAYRRKKRDAEWCKQQFIRDDEFTCLSSECKGDRQTDANTAFIVEIGQGPIPRLAWFEANIRIGIDALSEHYDNVFGCSRSYPLNFLSAHTESIPLANDVVDAMFCINALDHVGSISITLYELWRILKPNGLFFLGVLYDSSPLLCEEPHVVDKEFLEKELYPNFIVEQEALDSISEDEPPLGWYRARLRKREIPAYLHRFTPAQYAKISDFFQHFTEGMFLDYQGKFLEAKTSFQKALRYDGYYASDRYRLAYCAWRVAETSPALLHAVEQAKERYLQYVLLEAAYKRGSTHKRQGQLGESISIFSEVLKLTERLGFKRLCGGVHFHLGEIYLQGGEKEIAKKHFQDALHYISDHQKARGYLERMVCN